MKKKYFTLCELNARIRAFPYQEWENKPMIIKENNIKSRLKMSSAESMTFMRNFGALIGDLVPECDEHWLLFLKLKCVLDIIMDLVCRLNSHKYLSILIREYLTMLNDLFKKKYKAKTSSPHTLSANYVSNGSSMAYVINAVRK